jgi:hypothetical protein
LISHARRRTAACRQGDFSVTDQTAPIDFRSPSPEETAALIVEARRLRAAAFRDALTATVDALRRMAGRVFPGRPHTA